MHGDLDDVFSTPPHQMEDVEGTLHLCLCRSLSRMTLYIISLQIMMVRNIGSTRETTKKAHIKLSFVLVYFTLITVLTSVVDLFSVTVTPNLYLNALLPYFACESRGKDVDRDCEALLSEIQHSHMVTLSHAGLVLSGCIPLVVFVFSSDWKRYVNIVKKVTLCKCEDITG